MSQFGHGIHRAGGRFVILLVFSSLGCAWGRAQVPAYDGADPLATTKGKETAVLAGGCFWGVDAVFKHVKGVRQVLSGYAGGTVKSPEYEQVSTGRSGHAESVEIFYDPAKITYAQLLRVFFSVATDPTQLNRQGPDVGTQYRSVIFYGSEAQKQIAVGYIRQLDAAHVFPGPIVTEVVPLEHFYLAESFHQNYLEFHSDNPYIIQNDLPKLSALKREFPDLYAH